MVEYLCYRCGYVGKQKNHLKNHLNRKNVCKPTLDDIDIEEVKQFYNFEILETPLQITPNNSKIPQNHSKYFTPNNSKSLHFRKNFTPNNSKSLHFEKCKATCEYCLREYSRRDNLTKHLKTCKKKKEAESLVIQNEKIMKMEKEIEELKKCKNIINNNTTNSNNNNTNMINNIHINNYGDESLKHLRNKDFANLLSGIYSAVPKLIEKIHFDPDHPENQNIKFTNKKLPYLKVLKNDKWQLVSKKNELLDLIDNKCFLLREKYYSILEKNKYNLTEVHRKKINEFIDKYQEEDKKVMIDLIERTEIMLLNNS